MPELLVAKAGGTSNASAEAVQQSLHWAEQSNVFVVSAPGKVSSEPEGDKVTNLLLAGHDEYMRSGDVSEFVGATVAERFYQLRRGLGQKTNSVAEIPFRIRDAIRQGRDAVSMLGEQLQAEIYRDMGFILIDPGTAPRDLGADPESWRGWFDSFFDPNKKYVLPGNTTRTGGHMETFDRGGSDISGGLAAYAIRASLNLNLTDGPAMSTDPKLIGKDRARHIEHLTYAELRELGFNGTGLVHPTAVVPLMLGNIPTEVRSTFDTNMSPTLLDNDTIRAETRSGRIVALSLMKDVAIVRIHEPGMFEATGRLSTYEEAMRQRGVPLLDTKGDGVDDQKYFVRSSDAGKVAEALEAVVRPGSTIEASDNMTMVTMVGHRLDQRIIDNLFVLAFNSGVRAKQWQFEGYDMTFNRHSVRIGVEPSIANEVLDQLHYQTIEQKV